MMIRYIIARITDSLVSFGSVFSYEYDINNVMKYIAQMNNSIEITKNFSTPDNNKKTITDIITQILSVKMDEFK